MTEPTTSKFERAAQATAAVGATTRAGVVTERRAARP
jgi:hypothetical protein